MRTGLDGPDLLLTYGNFTGNPLQLFYLSWIIGVIALFLKIFSP